jgi:hypothetical protein
MGDVTSNTPPRITRPADPRGVDRRLAGVVVQQKDAGQLLASDSIFPPVRKGVMIATTGVVVTHLTGGEFGRAGGHPMTTQPIRPQSAGSSSHWYTTSPTCNRSYLLAGLRAGLIALVLLAVLAVIVWF